MVVGRVRLGCGWSRPRGGSRISDTAPRPLRALVIAAFRGNRPCSVPRKPARAAFGGTAPAAVPGGR
ncbi:hypothetical protein DF268_34945 [Streptomyces sp. V2]|nr:hypothetical protein DF268_34945 [Streptomyces sp. V2]